MDRMLLICISFLIGFWVSECARATPIDPCEWHLDDDEPSYVDDPTYNLLEAFVDNQDEDIRRELERRLESGSLPARMAIEVFEALNNPSYRWSLKGEP